MAGMSDQEAGRLVVIASFRDSGLARLAASRLETEGLPVFLEKERPGAGGLRLLVPAVVAGQAGSILQSDYSSALFKGQEAFGQAHGDNCCPHCGSADIAILKRRRRGVWSLLARLPSLL